MDDAMVLGVAAAQIVAQTALEPALSSARDASWAAMKRVATAVRDWFTDRDDTAGVAALEIVEAAPDSEQATRRLAERIAQAARDDSEGRTRLEGLVEATGWTGDVNVARFISRVEGNARVGRVIQTDRYDEHRG